VSTDLDRYVAPIGVQDMKGIMIHIGHRLFAFEMMLLRAHTHFPYRSLRFPHQDQKYSPRDRGAFEMLFRQIVLPLASSAIDHRNRVGLGPAPDSPAESAGRAHQMDVVQGIYRAGQILPPDPESSGIVPRAELTVQNDSIYAVVAARQQIPVQFTQSICHKQKIHEPAFRVQRLSVFWLPRFLTSTAPQGPLFRRVVREKA
jgi:hypothetical protein